MQAPVEPLPPSREELDPERVVEANTEVGPLWLERDAKILTPTVLETGRWQPDISDLVSRVLRPGMTVVDAGANVGFISVQASKLVGPNGRVYCIEADPSNVPILRANLWRNGCTNATVLPVAAWSKRAQLNLSVVPEGGPCSHVSAGPPQGSTVSACRLDALIRGKVDFLKVDCEGTDHLVLQGAAGLFQANPALIATVEFTPGRAPHTGHSPTEILEIYRGMGLKPYIVSVRGYLRPTTYERIGESGSDDGHVVVDFALCMRRPLTYALSYYLVGTQVRAFERVLELGGDLLEYVPERIRPRIRRRDRVSRS